MMHGSITTILYLPLLLLLLLISISTTHAQQLPNSHSHSRPGSTQPYTYTYTYTSAIVIAVAIFITGALSPWLLRRTLRAAMARNRPTTDGVLQDGSNKIYDLRHGVLNIDTAATEMWMNMGFWMDGAGAGSARRLTMADAGRGMVGEILGRAGIVELSSSTSTDAATAGAGAGDGGVGGGVNGGGEKKGSSWVTTDAYRHVKVNILDVGFGCGDQTMALARLDCLRDYVGITIDQKQYEFAERRLGRCGFLSDGLNRSDPDEVTRRVFNADAGRPSTWPDDTKEVLVNICRREKSDRRERNWILAVDVLYHFSPSRQAFFNYAQKEFRASIMAFDLLLPDPSQQRLTLVQSLLLRLLSRVTATPYSNFLTPSQYRSQLRDAGYADEDIEIHDISPHVFGPLVEFMSWQDKQLKAFGLGIGVFHAARWFFGWWARTGVVRGCIVVARRKTS